MPAKDDTNHLDLKPGHEVQGFQVRRTEPLPEIDAVFYELIHAGTGARYIHISRHDRENTFGVIFKTVPQNSTGVAHILEHVVLCGSERFPVRDPFFSMLKRSLSTFMNAFTASDWTMYPFSTQNRKDFYNLLDVYLDAAFFPRIDELSFKQEGHRLELEPDGGGGERLLYKGVVYNEMRGAMSAPDQVMGRSILKALYPDTTYANNSGGDPAEIPSLTYTALKQFHSRHYHPSNAFFYSYGDMPLAGHLAFIGKTVLNRFGAISPETHVKPQPRWKEPRVAGFPFPFARGEDPVKKHQVCVSWLTSDIRNTAEVLCLFLLEQVLIGNAGSPLRKALVDSGLGSALCDGSGYDAESRDTHFTVGLKDVEMASAEEIERIIFDTLSNLAAAGIDPDLIESAIHQLEFHRREITNTPYPYGIRLLLAIAGTWIHDGDPLRVLKFDADLTEIRGQMEAGRFFERLLERHFLENAHRILLTLFPDQEMAEREDQRVQAELARIRASLDPQALDQLRRDAEALHQLQAAEEPVDCLPTLERQDIPPEVEKITESNAEPDPPVIYYEQATSGIAYIAATADCRVLPADRASRLPFLCHAFSRIGTRLRDYTDMARRIDAFTGGVGLAAHPRTAYDGTGECIPFVALTAKSLFRHLAPMCGIVAEMVGCPDFTDANRLKHLLLEYRAGLESMIVHNGHRLAISLASRRFSAARALSEDWSGVHQFKTIKRLAHDLAPDGLQQLAEDLDQMSRLIFSRSNFQMAVVGERNIVISAGDHARRIFDGLSSSPSGGIMAPDVSFSGTTIREGWSTATAVNFVAAAFPAVRLEHEDSAALAVIAKLLRSLYLHREIREKGGAYGGFALYNSEDGTFSLVSYRDPHILTTLEVFGQAADFICAGTFTETDVKEAILQVCSEIDKPDPPGPAARKAFFRKIIFLTDEMRERFKQRLIGLSRAEVLSVAERYLAGGLKNCSLAVIGNEEALQEANRKLQEPLELHKI